MILPISAKLLFSVRAFSISTRCSNVKCFRLPLLFIFISNLHRQAISCKYSIHSNGYQRQYICAEVISMRLEFTLSNWKLKIHLSICNTIGFKILPLVKSVACNLDRISFVRLNFAKRVVIKIFDQFGINGTDKQVCC